jgi:enolase
MASPYRAVPFPDQPRIVAEVYQKLTGLLVEKCGVSGKNLGDEGGFAPPISAPIEAITIIEEAIVAAGYTPGTRVLIGRDAAASEFSDGTKKLCEVEVGVLKGGEQPVEQYRQLVAAHPGIEDGLDERDCENWITLTAALGARSSSSATICPRPIRRRSGRPGREVVHRAAAESEPNRAISEAIEAAKVILEAGERVRVSHRSGDLQQRHCRSGGCDRRAVNQNGPTARGERIQKCAGLVQVYECLAENDLLAPE